MLTEIEVEDVGIVRPLNSWQMSRVKRIKDRRNKAIAAIAFGFGMTVQQFRTLPIEKQRECREAALRLSAPNNVGPAR